jgi:hypothetical protein
MSFSASILLRDRIQRGCERPQSRIAAALGVGAHDDRIGAEALRDDPSRALRFALEHALVAEQPERRHGNLAARLGRRCARPRNQNEEREQSCREELGHAFGDHEHLSSGKAALSRQASLARSASDQPIIES